MFRNLGTSTKLVILCSTFIVAIVVAIYSLVVEKQIAIDFARKELVGVRYFEVCEMSIPQFSTSRSSAPDKSHR